MRPCRVGRRVHFEALELQVRPQEVPTGRSRLATLDVSGWGGGLSLATNGLAFYAGCC